MHWVDKAKLLMSERGISTRGLEKVIGCKKNKLSSLMSQRSVPASDFGIQISKAMQVTAEWLFDESLGIDDLEVEDLHKSYLHVKQALLQAFEALEREEKEKIAAARAAKELDEAAQRVKQRQAGKRSKKKSG